MSARDPAPPPPRAPRPGRACDDRPSREAARARAAGTARAWAEISLDAIRDNVRALLGAAPGARLLAVVKADAYGHGAVEVARAAVASGAWGLGVATVEEGVELRRAGLASPVLILGPAPPEHLETAVGHDLAITAFRLDTAQAASRAGRTGGAPAPEGRHRDGADRRRPRGRGGARAGDPRAAARGARGVLHTPRHRRRAGPRAGALAAGDVSGPAAGARGGRRGAARAPRREQRRHAASAGGALRSGAVRDRAVRDRPGRSPAGRPAAAGDAAVRARRAHEARRRGDADRLRMGVPRAARDDDRDDPGGVRRRLPAARRRERRGGGGRAPRPDRGAGEHGSDHGGRRRGAGRGRGRGRAVGRGDRRRRGRRGGADDLVRGARAGAQARSARVPRRRSRARRADAARHDPRGAGLRPGGEAAEDAPVRVAFQGEPGAYSEEAVVRLFGEVETVPCAALAGVFEAVEAGRADRGVVPVENSQAGSINETYDLLLAHDLVITGELDLRVSHCLLALPGQALRDI